MSNNITPDPKRIREIVARIDAIHDEILSVRGASMAECKALRNRIKDIYQQAADEGWPKRALRAAYVRLQLKREIEDQRIRLEDFNLQEDMDKIEQALGFETTPLGMAMMGEELMIPDVVAVTVIVTCLACICAAAAVTIANYEKDPER